MANYPSKISNNPSFFSKGATILKRKNRMFEDLRTWNPWFGCKYGCYRKGCWAYKRLAHRMGKMLKCQQCYDFKPHFHAERLTRIPRDPKIFVVAHGDLFGDWVPSGIIFMILEACRQTPKDLWFFETKNPRRYLEFLEFFPKNTMLSTTIETNRVFPTSIRGKTPFPDMRLEAMLEVKEQSEFPIHIANEPILPFDLEDMVEWMKMLEPKKISVGYDSLKNELPEMPKSKTLKLIKEYEKFTDVERKQL